MTATILTPGFTGPGRTEQSSREEDLELCRGAAAGDETACRTLVRRLLPRLRRNLAGLVGHASDGEDLAQAAIVQILEAAGAFRGDCALELWADRVSLRLGLRHLEKQRRRRFLCGIFEPWVEARDLPAELDANLVRTRLSERLSELPERLRSALIMHYVYGYSLAEISEIEAIPVGTVRERLYVGRRKLRKKILSDGLLRDWWREHHGER